MHKYMRAIGFSEYTDRKKLKKLLTDVVLNADERSYTMNNEGVMIGEFCRNRKYLQADQSKIKRPPKRAVHCLLRIFVINTVIVENLFSDIPTF